MDTLLFKLTLAPLLIAAATLASRRWGPTVGGWLTGLPLTSGPISVFLALEQGGQFAASAAVGSLLGNVGVVAFCVAYAQSAGRFGWRRSLLLSMIAYVLAVAALAQFSFSLPVAALAVLLALLAGVSIVHSTLARPVAVLAPRWDLPLRMLVAVLLLLAITEATHILGPQMSGILAPFPAFTCVMSVFFHIQNGAPSAHLFIRGILTATFAVIAFYIVVALLVGRNIPLAYAAASGAAVATHLIAYKALLRKKASSRPAAE